MPFKCCIPKCHSKYKRMKRSVFSFPKDEEMKKKWVALIPRNDLKVTKGTRVCALHFVESDIVREASAYDPETGRKLSCKLNAIRLKKDAVPSKFLCLSNPERESPEHRRRRLENEQLQRAMNESLEISVKGQPQLATTDKTTVLVPVMPTDMFRWMGLMAAATRTWRKDDITALIALYQSEKCLYDKNHANYYNLDDRNKAYQRIQNMLINICPDCTIPQIENEINSLHNRYVCEKSYKDWSIKAGQFTEDTYEPEMWCFALLEFLDDHIVVNAPREIKVEPRQDNDQYEISTFNCIDVPNIKVEKVDGSDANQELQCKNIDANPEANNEHHEEEVDKEYHMENHEKSRSLNSNSGENWLSNKDNKTKEKQQNNKSLVSNKMLSIGKKFNQDSGQREDVFGEYIASEMRTLKNNSLLYLKTKQAIISVLTNASFEFLNIE